MDLQSQVGDVFSSFLKRLPSNQSNEQKTCYGVASNRNLVDNIEYAGIHELYRFYRMVRFSNQFGEYRIEIQMLLVLC